jgi:hypothetical protein
MVIATRLLLSSSIASQNGLTERPTMLYFITKAALSGLIAAIVSIAVALAL